MAGRDKPAGRSSVQATSLDAFCISDLLTAEITWADGSTIDEQRCFLAGAAAARISGCSPDLQTKHEK
jgi:hypothetical protein